jgi:hypothetical protein
MGLTEVLTLIFVVLKLTHQIDWSWWLVLLPEIIALVWYGIGVLVVVIFGVSAVRLRRRR